MRTKALTTNLTIRCDTWKRKEAKDFVDLSFVWWPVFVLFEFARGSYLFSFGHVWCTASKITQMLFMRSEETHLQMQRLHLLLAFLLVWISSTLCSFQPLFGRRPDFQLSISAFGPFLRNSSVFLAWCLDPCWSTRWFQSWCGLFWRESKLGRTFMQTQNIGRWSWLLWWVRKFFALYCHFFFYFCMFLPSSLPSWRVFSILLYRLGNVFRDFLLSVPNNQLHLC